MGVKFSLYSITKTLFSQCRNEGFFCYRSAAFSSHSMNIQHFEKGFTLNDTDLILFAKKIGKLATYCRKLKDEGSFIRVETEQRDTKKSQDSVKVMVTVHLPKKDLRVESRKNNALDALDSCIEKLEPQVKRYKEMTTGKGRKKRR